MIFSIIGLGICGRVCIYLYVEEGQGLTMVLVVLFELIFLGHSIFFLDESGWRVWGICIMDPILVDQFCFWTTVLDISSFFFWH
jgi:hypothetical protein